MYHQIPFTPNACCFIQQKVSNPIASHPRWSLSLAALAPKYLKEAGIHYLQLSTNNTRSAFRSLGHPTDHQDVIRPLQLPRTNKHAVILIFCCQEKQIPLKSLLLLLQVSAKRDTWIAKEPRIYNWIYCNQHKTRISFFFFLQTR